MSAIIEVEDLRKTYTRFRKPPTVALDGVSFEVPEGGVFGFLGPNGSGKTTTIRCLLALASQDSGRVRVFGKDAQQDLHEVIDKIGALVEAPALFPGFSGRRNLEILARMRGFDRGRIDPILERVGLAGRGDELVKGYSLGMRQRLAIGAALLKDPSLLILDEPANGLDPAGIREVRELLRSLGAEGRTVFVSSHILAEVEQIADRVAILRKGKEVAIGSVDKVLGGGDEGSVVIIRMDEAEAGLAHLLKKGFEAAIVGDHIRVAMDPADAADAVRALAGKRLYPYEVRAKERLGLEDVFFSLTADEIAGSSVGEDA
ncbi:MAG: ABC transporter ATP-binding protein [Actinomycetota bacterium]